MRLREKALNGDPRAMDRLLALAQQVSTDKEAASTERALIASEEDILARYLQSSGAQTGSDDSESDNHIDDPECGGQSDDE